MSIHGDLKTPLTNLPGTSKQLSTSTRVRLEEALEIAVEAYVYAYPLVLMHLSRRQATNIETPAAHGAPINQFYHARQFPDPAFADQARPNVDTLESKLWLDLSREPIVVHVPNANDRHVFLPMLDMWTNVFASPGPRTTGSHAQLIAIVGPDWRGSLPGGFEKVRSPTTHAWLIARLQVNGTADYAAAHKFQDALRAEPLSQIRSPYKPPKGRVQRDYDMRPPIHQLSRLSGAKFFALFLETTKLDQPHFEDSPILSRMKRIGLEPGKPLGIETLPLTVKAALHDAPKTALRQIMDATQRIGNVANGWAIASNPIGTYGTDYVKRAGTACFGLGAAPIEDMLCATLDERSCRHPLDSGARYRLHFAAHHIPPTHAFWSVTMHNSRHFLAANSIDRYMIGSRDPLRFNADGSLDIYLQRESPGTELESNWLPTPGSGAFSLALRVYWPKTPALDGSWAPPPIVKIR